jgi:H+/Cl- antiporter ClcA
MIARLRLLLFAGIGGALTGLISFAFLRSLDAVTRTRVAHGWLVWLLPVAGLVIGLAYHHLGGRARGGTPEVIEQANTFTQGVPARMAPLIFGGSMAGHLVGASVGREGAALQLAGSVTDSAARLGALSDQDRRILIAASLAGGWGAVFGVPVTGVVFTLQMTRRHRWQALAPAITSGFAGMLVVKALGYRVPNRPSVHAPDWTVALPLKLAIAGVVTGAVARLFVALLKVVKVRSAALVPYPPLRPLLGAAATMALVVLVGRDYLGLSGPLLATSFGAAHVSWWVPLVKLVFTVVALGTGFVGGEVAPLFVMGATAGAAVAPGLHAPGPLLATTGSAAAFAAAASVALTGVVLTVEQFGWHTLAPALIVGGVARLVAGRPGLYVAH